MCSETKCWLIKKKAVGDLSADTVETNAVVFDGRYYWYKQYRYDLSSDAENYARLDRSRQSSQLEPVINAQFKEAVLPSSAESERMAQLAITFDGKWYRYAEYRYENFIDAINYANRVQHLSRCVDNLNHIKGL